MAMAGEVEQQGLGLARGLAAQGLVDAGAHGVEGLGRRDDALTAGEHHAGLEGGDLRHGHCLDELLVIKLGDEW